MIYERLKKEDEKEFFLLAGNEKVAATMRFDCPKTLESSNEILNDYLSKENRAFALRTQKKEKLWGVFAFKSEKNSDVAGLSLMLLPEQWGKGTGFAVTESMVKLAKKEKWYRALEVYILEKNEASRKIAEKCKFQEKQRLRFEGMSQDLVVYRLNFETQ